MNKIPFWFEVFVPFGPGALEPVSELLFTLGCTGTEERENGLTAWFDPGRLDREPLLEALQGGIGRLRASGMIVGDPHMRTIKSRDWNEAWRAWFKPVPVTPALIVRPPWEKYKASPGMLELIIMPRMAFGTGTHETTQLCLEMLESTVQPGATLLDIGAGSGILAVAAAKWQADRVTAVEIDPLAVGNCAENADLNGVREKIRVVCGTLDCIRPQRYDMITANINTQVLSAILPDLVRYLSGSGRLILSGILASESGAFVQTLVQHGYTVADEHDKGEWAGILATA